METVKGILIATIGLLLFVGSALGAGAPFPTRPVNVIVGGEAGSGSDTMLRSVVPIVQKILGRPLIVENRPGGSGVLAIEILKRAKPDGHTLLGGTDSPLTRMPHEFTVSYDLQRDFSCIIQQYIMSAAVLVRSDSPFKKFKDLIDFARKNPGQLTVGIPSISSAIALGLRNIANQEKVNFQFIPFQGSAPTVTAILGGHVMSASFVTSAFRPHVRAGTLRALLVFGEKRMEDMPDVPSSLELGYGPEVSNLVLIQSGVVAPKAIPKPAKDKLIHAFSEAIKSPGYRSLAAKNGMTIPDPLLLGEDMDRHYKKLYDLYGKYIKSLGIQKK